jgi:hypothetical protein
MRRLFLGAPPVSSGNRDELTNWIVQSITEIERASYDNDAAQVADDYTVTNGVTTRTLNVSTATANDVAKVLGTLITDLKNRGVKKGL